VRIDPDTCRDADLLAAEVRRLHGVIAASEPALTDAERAAIEKLLRLLREDYFAGRSYQSVELAAVIDGLLDRIG
jgi:hypothetical protein